MASAGLDVQSIPSAEPTTRAADLPPELIPNVLRFLDVDTIAQTASLVCRAWRDAARDVDTWQGRMSPRLLGQLKELQALGPPVSPAHLHLALAGRNFLRNPGFRREDNSVLMLPLGPLGSGRWTAWRRWQSTAWVVNTAVGGKEVRWEPAPAGMAAPDPVKEALEPPLPYPGTGRLVTRMRRAFQGVLDFVQRGVAIADGVSAATMDAAAAAAAQRQQQRQQQQQAELPMGDGVEADARRQQRQQVQQLQPQPQPQWQRADMDCLATHASWSEVVQVIDLDWELQRRGLTAAQAAHLLDAGLGLRLRVHVGARLDSEAEYAVALLLDEGPGGGSGSARSGRAGRRGGGADADAFPSLQSFVPRPSRHLGYREDEHLPPGTWQRFEYELPAVPRGARRAIVMLRGRRAPTATSGGGGGHGGGLAEPQEQQQQPQQQRQPLATRFCGAKFASAQLVFE